MDEFHSVPWEHRPRIVERFSDPRLKALGLRLIHHERPDLLPESDRIEQDWDLARRVGGIGSDIPWLTLPTALAQMEELLGGSPDHASGHLEGHRQLLMRWMADVDAMLSGGPCLRK